MINEKVAYTSKQKQVLWLIISFTTCDTAVKKEIQPSYIII